ncbi:MAG TPA: hypothetical protein VLD57_11700 [Blastocatellia bacterium]|nr:hypothetical protein [Blastocatellia bacterium]
MRFKRPGQTEFDTHVVEDLVALSIPTVRVNHELSNTDSAPIQATPDKMPSAHYDSIDESIAESDIEYEYPECEREAPDGLIERIRNDRPSFKIAAIATMVGLALFGLTAAYRLYSYGARKPEPSVPSATVDTSKEAQPSYFIDTPQQAREYVEGTPTSEEAQSKTSPSASPEANSPSSQSIDNREQAGSQSQKTQAQPTGRTDAARSIMTPQPDQRLVEGAVEVRLKSIRASRSQAGYRYDLTFNMREAGRRQVRWEKLTISARSSSGHNHLQAIPFNHRLVASGALTFTVSVEMTGRSEPDWRGRLVCTTVGVDNLGRPVRAAFGASVAP